MKALSIRQPWAWAILHAGKRVENRSWYCHYRGPILIHASKGGPLYEWADDFQAVQSTATRAGVELPRITLRMLREQSGGIVGRARIMSVICPGGVTMSGHQHSLASDPWYTGGHTGEYGIVLADVEPLAFVPWKGAPGLFDVAEAAEREVRDRLENWR